MGPEMGQEMGPEMGPEKGPKMSRKSPKSETIQNSKMPKVSHFKSGKNVQNCPEIV